MPGRLAALLISSIALAGCAGAHLRPIEPPVAAAPAGGEGGGIAAYGFEAGDVGYLVRDLDTGRVLAAHNAGRTFIPASVVKLPTAIAALELLGGDHRFRTESRASGDVVDGVLAGDLILVGGGDPLLGPDDLLALCGALRRQGVRRIAGALRYDASRYRARASIQPRQPSDARYNPGVSALSLDFNRLRVEWRPGEAAGGVDGFVVPPAPGVELAHASAPPASGQDWLADVDGEVTRWRLSPAAPRAGAASLPVKRPARLTAQVFRRLCRQADVDLPPPRSGRAGADTRPLAVHRGQPLTDVVQAMLRYSNNLVAELVGLAAGRALTGQAMAPPESASALAAWWRGRLPDVDWRGYASRNHSGLDARGRATPAQLTAMLAFAAERVYADGAEGRRSLADLLPAGGWDGGLGGRLDEPASALRVWAKTGTMHYASALAGYIFPASGRRLAFAIFVCDPALRRAYDAAPARRGPEWHDRTAAWRDRAKALEAELARLWVQRWDADGASLR